MINNKKPAIFKLIAILLPFLFLMLFETLLRLIGYGNDYRIFIEDKSGSYLYLNPGIGKKYFTSEKNATVGLMDPFKKIKDKNTFRIFVMGESTAEGFPYMYNGTFPRILKYRLQTTFPDINFEVINLSLTAVNSYTLLDFTNEVIKQKPDAVLIYVGHNEYHGTLGIASNSGIGTDRFLVRTLLFCKKARLVQLVLNLTNNLKKHDKAMTDPGRSLMERMASGQKIPFKSKLYFKGIQQFEKNLNDILQNFNKNNIPVYIGNLVSNEKDQKPFISMLTDTMHIYEWKNYYEKGLKAYTSNDMEEAFACFTHANQIDSTSALCNYFLGNIEYRTGEYLKASRYYSDAKELDNLRFRAPEVFNEVISNIAARYRNVTLVNIKDEFEKHSPHRILGNELFLDHVHPNLEGYFLMANAFYNAMKNKQAISDDWSSEIPDTRIRSELPITLFDTIYGNISVISLKEHWPFNEPIPKKYYTESKSFEEDIARGFALKQFSWESAMIKLYNYYIEKKDFKNALKIAEGLVLNKPYNCKYIEQAAKLAYNMDNPLRALFYLKRLWHCTQNMDLAQHIFVVSLKADKPEESLPYIDYAIAHNTTGHDFYPLKELISEIILLKKELNSNKNDVELLCKISIDYYLADCSFMARKYFRMAYLLDKNSRSVKELQKIINSDGPGL